jgi:hypothetical protein
VFSSDQTHHSVSPPEPLIQPLLPILTKREAVLWMLIKEHVVAAASQPIMQLGSQQMILTCMTHEYPGHYNL